VKVTVEEEVRLKISDLRKVTETSDEHLESDNERQSVHSSTSDSDSDGVVDDDDDDEDYEEEEEEGGAEGSDEEESETAKPTAKDGSEGTRPKLDRKPLSALASKRQETQFKALNKYVKMPLLNPEAPMHVETKDTKDRTNENVGVKWTVTRERMEQIYKASNGMARYGNKDGPEIPYVLKKEYGDKNLDVLGEYGVAIGRPKEWVCNFVTKASGVVTSRCVQTFETLYLWRKHLLEPVSKGGHAVPNVQNDHPVCQYCCSLFPNSREFTANTRRECMQKHLPCEPLKSPAGKDITLYCTFCLDTIVNPQLVLFDDLLKYRDHQAIMHERKFPSLFYCGICGLDHTKDTARRDCQKTCLEKEELIFYCRLCTHIKKFSSAVEKAVHYENNHKHFMHQCFLVNIDSKQHKKKNNTPAHLPVYDLKLAPDGRVKCPYRCGPIVIQQPGESRWHAIWDHVRQNHVQRTRMQFVNRYVPATEKANYNPM